MADCGPIEGMRIPNGGEIFGAPVESDGSSKRSSKLVIVPDPSRGRDFEIERRVLNPEQKLEAVIVRFDDGTKAVVVLPEDIDQRTLLSPAQAIISTGRGNLLVILQKGFDFNIERLE